MYLSIIPEWIARSSFCPELESHTLEEHNYCDNTVVKYDAWGPWEIFTSLILLNWRWRVRMTLPLPMKNCCSLGWVESIFEEVWCNSAWRKALLILLLANNQIIPTMRPFEISLNSKEHILVSFRPYFEKV